MDMILFTRDVRNGYMDFSENLYRHYYYSCSEGVHLEFSFGMDTIPLYGTFKIHRNERVRLTFIH